MSYRRKRGLTQEEINAILFADDSSDDREYSEIDDDDDFEENDTSVIFSSTAPGNSDSDSDASSEDTEEKFENADESDEEEQEVTWTSTVNSSAFSFHNFEGDPGPVHNLPPGSNALDYFKLLFTNDMLEEIRINTNKYAEFCQTNKEKQDKNWAPIEKTEELEAFICIQLIMSI
ncbi:hypothetical protein JTE90_023644, partial [Oedothorax gibbosus]